ncbi:MAG: hypothetical protein ACLFT5_07535, partial [Desulfovermiculus sp.]
WTPACAGVTPDLSPGQAEKAKSCFMRGNRQALMVIKLDDFPLPAINYPNRTFHHQFTDRMSLETS